MLAKRIVLTLAIAMLAAAPAQAVILTYSVEADYNAAVGAELWRVDFNDQTAGSLGEASYTDQVDFGSTEVPLPFSETQVMYVNDAGAGSAITSANYFAPVDGIFDSPVLAFAWEFSVPSDFRTSGEQTVILFDALDNEIGQFASDQSGFFGISSDQAISRFEIRRVSGPGSTVFAPASLEVGGPVIDNFRANDATAIPEPGTIFLLGSGLVGLGAAYRKRKR